MLIEIGRLEFANWEKYWLRKNVKEKYWLGAKKSGKILVKETFALHPKNLVTTFPQWGNFQNDSINIDYDKGLYNISTLTDQIFDFLAYMVTPWVASKAPTIT